MGQNKIFEYLRKEKPLDPLKDRIELSENNQSQKTLIYNKNNLSSIYNENNNNDKPVNNNNLLSEHFNLNKCEISPIVKEEKKNHYASTVDFNVWLFKIHLKWSHDNKKEFESDKRYGKLSAKTRALKWIIGK